MDFWTVSIIQANVLAFNKLILFLKVRNGNMLSDSVRHKFGRQEHILLPRILIHCELCQVCHVNKLVLVL